MLAKGWMRSVVQIFGDWLVDKGEGRRLPASVVSGWAEFHWLHTGRWRSPWRKSTSDNSQVASIMKRSLLRYVVLCRYGHWGVRHLRPLMLVELSWVNLGNDLGGSKEPSIRWQIGSGSSQKGVILGGHVPAYHDVPTTHECILRNCFSIIYCGLYASAAENYS